MPPPRQMPPPSRSARLLLRLAPQDTALFRFLLEAHDNLAYFTSIEPGTALLKLVFSPHQRADVIAALERIAKTVPLEWRPWPFDDVADPPPNDRQKSPASIDGRAFSGQTIRT